MSVLVRFIRKWCVPGHERGQERFRRAGLTGSTGVLAQGLFLLTGLVSIPLTASYLGAEAYGNDDRQTARELVATAFWALLGFGVLIAVALVALADFIPIDHLFRISAPALVREVKWASILAIGSFLLTFPLGV